MSDTRAIITTYSPPPIPDRRMDWTAIFEDYDGAESQHRDPIGWGASEAAAIRDLKQQAEDAE